MVFTDGQLKQLNDDITSGLVMIVEKEHYYNLESENKELTEELEKYKTINCPKHPNAGRLVACQICHCERERKRDEENKRLKKYKKACRDIVHVKKIWASTMNPDYTKMFWSCYNLSLNALEGE